MIDVLLFSFGVLVIFAIGLWGISVALRDVSIVDPCWGLGFILVAAVTALRLDQFGPRGYLMIGLVTVWGGRLSAYLFWRHWGAGEDYRYAEMRAHHGARFWWISLGTVFLLQAIILWFVSWPVQAALVSSSQSLSGLDGVGVLVWAIGFFFEAVGDYQLASFLRSRTTREQVLDRGLWRYTRHPNYFGDFCVWWGLYLVAAAGGGGWTILSPLLMSVLLIYVSGVRLTEKTIEDRRPAYRAYKRSTSAFFPLPPQELD